MGIHEPRHTSNSENPYGFNPTLWITILFTALFFCTTVVHVLQALRYKILWLLPTFGLCGFGEVLGWAGRIWSSRNPLIMDPYLMQICCTIFSPTFLTAGVFFILGRIINIVGPEDSRLTPKTYAIVFTGLDVAALIVQSIGGGQASAAPDLEQANKGAHVMVGGIILQMVAITLYILIQAEWLFRVLKDRPLRKSTTGPDSEKGDNEGGTLKAREKITPRIRLMLAGLAITVVLVYTRSIYRTIELLDGWHGPIITNETLFNTLDGTPIFLAMVTMNIFHVGYLVPLP